MTVRELRQELFHIGNQDAEVVVLTEPNTVLRELVVTGWRDCDGKPPAYAETDTVYIVAAEVGEDDMVLPPSSRP